MWRNSWLRSWNRQITWGKGKESNGDCTSFEDGSDKVGDLVEEWKFWWSCDNAIGWISSIKTIETGRWEEKEGWRGIKSKGTRGGNAF